jgi:hypothetical protein
MAPLRVITGFAKIVLAVIAVVLFGAGIPFLWIWIGSQLQGGTAPSFGGIGVALFGIVGSYALLATVFAWVKDRYAPQEGPVRHTWNRSLSAERRTGPSETTPIEDIAAGATVVVAIVCTLWFLLFGDPGVPVGP